MTRARIASKALALFGAIALGLAAIGIYGLMSYSVNQRTHEIGIRMALGAKREEVLRLVVRQGLVLAMIGVALGTAGALLLTRFLSSMLYGVGVNDPMTLLSVAALLSGVAALASFIPAADPASTGPATSISPGTSAFRRRTSVSRSAPTSVAFGPSDFSECDTTHLGSLRHASANS